MTLDDVKLFNKTMYTKLVKSNDNKTKFLSTQAFHKKFKDATQDIARLTKSVQRLRTKTFKQGIQLKTNYLRYSQQRLQLPVQYKLVADHEHFEASHITVITFTHHIPLLFHKESKKPKPHRLTQKGKFRVKIPTNSVCHLNDIKHIAKRIFLNNSLF